MRKQLLTLTAIFSFIFVTNAQSGVESILLTTQADSEKLLKAYFAPGMEGFMNAMNSGWYHTAKVHKVLGFDIAIGASGALMPSDRETFNITALNLASINTSSNTAQTFAGNNTTTPMQVNTSINGQNVSANFDMPGGIKGSIPGNAIPAPFAQVSIGLPWKLEAMVRFVPKINIGEDDGSIDMYGIGLKKEITSWFGPLDKTPLHVSLLAAYSKMNFNYATGDLDSEFIEVRNGLTQFNLSTFTTQAIASLNFPIINIYGGVGFNSGSSSYEMTGTFTGIYDTGLPAPNNKLRQQLFAPSNLDFNTSGMMATAGVRLSLGFLKIFGSYTFQEFNTANLGVAISIR